MRFLQYLAYLAIVEGAAIQQTSTVKSKNDAGLGMTASQNIHVKLIQFRKETIGYNRRLKWII